MRTHVNVRLLLIPALLVVFLLSTMKCTHQDEVLDELGPPSYEYGTDIIEMHADSIKAGDRVLLVDDLIATGGTAEAAVKLLRELGADLIAACFVVDLPELGGREKLHDMGVTVRTLVEFEGL